MPIVIVGTGRSGTSMVARMLNLSGVYFGDPKEIAAKDEWNPRGFWEHDGMHRINEGLLALLTQKYGFPPKLDSEWECDPMLAELYGSTRRYIEKTFGGRGEWGWKSPGATITLPFWLRVVPDLKVVVCVRNPLDYAASTEKYHKHSREFALANWQFNTLYALSLLDPEQRWVAFYEDYFPDYRRALDRMLQKLGVASLTPGGDADRTIQAFHDPDLKHHSASADDVLSSPDVPYLAKELYFEMLVDKEIGSGLPILKYAAAYLPLMRQAITPDEVDRQLEARLARELRELRNQNAHMEQILASRTHRIAARVCDFLARRPFKNLPRLPAPPEFDFRPAPAPSDQPAKV